MRSPSLASPIAVAVAVAAGAGCTATNPLYEPPTDDGGVVIVDDAGRGLDLSMTVKPPLDLLIIGNCGASGQPCCGGGKCNDAGDVCAGNVCRHCGGGGEPCCPPNGTTPQCGNLGCCAAGTC